jgi:hypothetical protein
MTVSQNLDEFSRLPLWEAARKNSKKQMSLTNDYFNYWFLTRRATSSSDICILPTNFTDVITTLDGSGFPARLSVYRAFWYLRKTKTDELLMNPIWWRSVGSCTSLSIHKTSGISLGAKVSLRDCTALFCIGINIEILIHCSRRAVRSLVVVLLSLTYVPA